MHIENKQSEGSRSLSVDHSLLVECAGHLAVTNKGDKSLDGCTPFI